METHPPIYGSKQNLILPRLVKGFGIQRKEFSKLSGVSESLLSRTVSVSARVRSQVSELVSIYMVLWKLTEKDEDAIINLLNLPDDQYFGLSPIQFMKMDRKNIQVVLRNLQELTYGEAMGA
jgi:hypothetical protein